VGRLLVLVLVTTLVDAQLRCAHFQHQTSEVRARAYDELRLTRASSVGGLSNYSARSRSNSRLSEDRSRSQTPTGTRRAEDFATSSHKGAEAKGNEMV